MSLALVAYGSSDESEGSDSEENTQQKSTVNDGTNLSINQSNEGTTDSRDLAVERSLDGKLRDLPEPKAPSSSVIEETDELEDEVKPKASQLADAPKPPAKKLRKPVQITIPALPDEEEKSDDSEPIQKKPKIGPAAGKSGLTSLLPAPVHAAKKEAGRILLPYSLTRKVTPNPTPPTNKKPTVMADSQKTKSLTTSLADYGSDSDENDGNSDEPVNFFSLGSASGTQTKTVTQASLVNKLKSVEQTVSLPPTVTRTSLNLPAPMKDNIEVNKSKNVDVVIKGVSEQGDVVTDDTTSVSHRYGPTVDPDAPLSFKGGVSHGYPSYSGHSPASQMMYSVEYAGSHSYPEVDDDQALQQDEQFLRLQGKKQRGKEEIHIMDVNADDFTSPTEISKYISEEQPHQSHRKKDSNMPTHQQKRKHQIQYLAFEAKERELELKNQWSNNKMTRKQTQAKYGF